MTVKHLVLFQFKADIGPEAISDVRPFPYPPTRGQPRSPSR